jgi:hypothetical protein
VNRKFEKVMKKGMDAARKMAKHTRDKEAKILLLMFAVGCQPCEMTDGRRKRNLHAGDSQHFGHGESLPGVWPKMAGLKY